jgi:hypothetical protein
MKRLFTVHNIHFESKMDAKSFRNVSGGHISKGPDHHSFHKNPKTHFRSSGHKSSNSTGDGFKRNK